LLAEQARQVNPRWVAVADALAAARFERSLLPRGTRLLSDEAELADAIAAPEVDVVVSAVVGSAGLRGTWAALEAGKRVALANKETLVMAGQLASRLARDRDAEIIPVDSEHSAIFQALRAGKREHLRRVILTASGGPFRHHSSAALSQVTVEEALNHPTWEMGRKITVDSATMMNKALEIIEARWLFDLDADQISVAIHPQSIVHSLVEFVDGSVVAQMSPPDMRLPIQYALTYPDRQPSVARKMDFSGPFTLEFEPPDFDRFPALGLGLEAARAGGTAGAVLSAANEAAVEGFLAGELQFPDITSVCRAVLDHHSFDANPSLVQLEALDRWARQEVTRWVCT
jgi:1-deoxy-D-xylulose-5-phosphate reductoisomerase